MKITYGIHDYKTIKAEDYLFVDKTNFIKKLEDIGRYIVFLRPRRFGKSLFTSMLYYYYDLNSGPITELKTPNYIIQNVYFEYYYHYLNEMLNINLDVWHIEEAVLELSMHNNVNKFIKVVEKFLHELSTEIILNLMRSMLS